jgi:hypothetical protein
MRWLTIVGLLGCGGTPPSVAVGSAAEIGVVGQSSNIVGRDGGWGTRAFGHEVFVFGDTFVTKADATGSSFHSNSFSFTDDASAADGIAGLADRLDPLGSPVPLVPPTTDEAAYNAAHFGDACATPPCGARWALWAGATVFDATRGRALVSYGLVDAKPGAWNFSEVGQGLAVWDSFDQQARRPIGTACPDHPTLLFCAGTDWASSLVIDGDDLYGFACTGSGPGRACKLARAPLANPLDPAAWQAWNGAGYGALADAAVLFEGDLNMRVMRDAYVGGWIAVYSNAFSNQVSYRTAPALAGPWSDAATLFVAKNPNTTYDAYLQPDYSEDGGRVVYVTFSRSTGLFSSELALERIELRR